MARPRPSQRRGHSRPASRADRRSFAARHLDGWPLGLLIVALAASSVLLAVPRAAVPREIPTPVVDGRALARTVAQDGELARQARTHELDVDVRAVGSELRAYNCAAERGDDTRVVELRPRLLAAAAKALRRSETELLALRAYQLEGFLEELHRWQRTGELSDELRELGGDFLRIARRNGWCLGPDRHLVPDESTLRVFFKRRWNEVVGVSGGPFALTSDEERLRFGFFLREPWNDGGLPDPTTATDRRRAEAQSQRARLAVLDKLAAVDPDYPVELARGIVLFQMQQYRPAAEAFRRQLARSPDGPWVLRAQNHLKEALDRAASGPG